MAAESGRVVLVTGSGRGIGRATAEAFLAQGDAVVLTELDGELLAATAAELGCEGHRLDVRDWDAVHRVVDDVARRTGRIDVLVNNAGIMSRHAVVETDRSEWEAVLGTNLGGTFACCHAVLPHQRRHGAGCIVNVGSIWASHAWPNRAAYSASKAGVEQFTRALATEVGPEGIRVNAISPGLVATDMTAGVRTSQAFLDGFMTRTTTRTFADPREDVAALVVFLASDHARYMHGEVVELHGGYH